MLDKLDGYKKLTAAIVASVLAYLGFVAGMDNAQIGFIITPLTGYILAQGAADFGKSAAKIHSHAPIATLEPVVLVEEHQSE